MTSETRLPFYAKSTFILLGLVLVTGILYYAAEVFVPLAYAALLSVLLYPMSYRLERIGIPRVLAITLTLTVALILVATVIGFIVWQAGQFSQDLPVLKERVFEYARELKVFLKENFGITYQKQLQWLRLTTSRVFENGGVLVSQTLLAFTKISYIMVLVPIYTFLFLLYRPLLVEFFFQLSSRGHIQQVKAVLDEIKRVVKNYLLGLMIETVIVAVLNVGVLLYLGIDYAVLLGVTAAILNLIPYVGIFIGSIFPTVIAFMMEESLWAPVSVVIAFSIIQFLDNNIIVPKIVGSYVRINSIATIIAVIVGGLLWGISGMFLFIPLVAILKVIFDRVESLKPWGMLLGDGVPKEARIKKPRAAAAKAA